MEWGGVRSQEQAGRGCSARHSENMKQESRGFQMPAQKKYDRNGGAACLSTVGLLLITHFQNGILPESNERSSPHLS